MARHKMLNGNRVWLTAEEETARVVVSYLEQTL